MALLYHPKQGTIVVARFEPGFKKPEIVKKRLAIVVSKAIQARHGLCTVVPLSLTPPKPEMRFHAQINPDIEIPDPWGNQTRWIKGDLVYAAGFHRLDLLSLGRAKDGKRIYQIETISSEDMKRVQACILEGLSLGRLTKDL